MKKFFYKMIIFFNKDKWYSHLLRFGLCTVLLAIIIGVVLQDSLSNMVEIAISFLASTLLLYIGKVVFSLFEDTAKVSCDTETMFETYDKSYRKNLELNGTAMPICYADTFVNNKELETTLEFKVVDSNEQSFVLDDFIADHFDQLISAHSNSDKFNGLTIRLDDFKREGSALTFKLSRSTIFNHLVTNRAIDFVLSDDVSLRSLFEFGPRLHPFSESKMSNHVGINGLIYLSDGCLLLPQRSLKSTISKNKVTSSIATKLNFPENSALIDASYLFYDNIKDNIVARTRLAKKDIPQETEIHFLGFGQNVYEGGKPQFYFSVMLPLTKDDYLQKVAEYKECSKEYNELIQKYQTEKGNASAKYAELPKDIADRFRSDRGLPVDWKPLANLKLDVDKCIHVADPETFQFKGNKLKFSAYKKDSKKYKKKLGFEMSFLCNLWHYKEFNK